jgi:peptidyl-prolyl cis-trans isomerase C
MKYIVSAFLSATMLMAAMPAISGAVESKHAPASAPKPAAAPAPVKDYLIAEVGGEKIFYRDVEKTWNELFPGEGAAPPIANFGDAIRDNVVRGLVSEKLMIKAAEKARLGESADAKEKLAQLKNQLMVQELLKQEGSKRVSAEAVKQRYQEMAKKMAGKEEIHASHILVKTKEEADKLAKEIKAGGDFSKIAKEKSMDKGSAVRGGDLDYFGQEQMVPEFSTAAFKLKKGEVSAPVQTPFGWHIIKLLDRRAVPVPSFEQSRPQVEQQLQSEANQAYILELLKTAKLKYYTPDGKEAPFPAEQKAPIVKQ